MYKNQSIKQPSNFIQKQLVKKTSKSKKRLSKQSCSQNQQLSVKCKTEITSEQDHSLKQTPLDSLKTRTRKLIKTNNN